ncbi:hypothetical protein [Deinococcus maricopensis]|uniref:Uncharacterized protein n=1 Tax=Deinococcus maricopensis (strain DSM 21211 / LMG 22137 / NRRL B-23946 / LB-34) TaxID=709986 RepID=E8U4F1_DEIML|nr:hypothetical protein [Deinococcus maricopensis]ADV68816.1 hypothetical protein Deima_3188 [Deinococcus maricopensis DSM 21211]
MFGDLFKGLQEQMGRAQRGDLDEREAGQVVTQYMQQAPAEQQRDAYRDFVRTLSPDQRSALAQAINAHPDTPVTAARHDDDDDLAGAIQQSGPALIQKRGPQTQDGRSPLEEMFAPGGTLANPMVKAGLVGLAAAIGSQVLRGHR